MSFLYFWFSDFLFYHFDFSFLTQTCLIPLKSLYGLVFFNICRHTFICLQLFYFLPVLPALRLICSPAYLIPLPLYTSGKRFALISAAISPTVCLFEPFIVIFTFWSTEIVIPSGGTTKTGCEYPKSKFKFLPSILAR